MKNRASKRPLIVVSAVAGAVVAAQAGVIARLLLDRGRGAEQRSRVPLATPVLPPREDVAAVPPQDPHSPPTGPIKISHRPPGGVPQAPDTDADSGSVGDASGETPGESTRAGERSLS